MLTQRNLFYLGVLALYFTCMFCYKKDLNTCVGVSVLTLVILQFGGKCFQLSEGYESQSYAPVNFGNGEEGMSQYDGRVITATADDSYTLNDPNDLYTLQGTPSGLEDAVSKYDPVSNNYPSVDGTDDGPKSLFAFAFNKSSPACCPSTYSTDRGCVCTTKQQRDFINKRGGNRKGLITNF